MPEDLNWINANSIYVPTPPKEPPVDDIISEIVGYKVYTTDPRILKTVVAFKRKRQGTNDDIPDNLSENPEFIRAIKKAFEQPI